MQAQSRTQRDGWVIKRGKRKYSRSTFEATARLGSILDVIENEIQGLEVLGDGRLEGVLQAATVFRAEVVATLAAFAPPPTNGDRAI